jgi:hypothetical protein
MIAFERRASTVMFNLLRSHGVEGPFLLPANVCPIVPMVFFKARRPFEFVDIAPGTLCMDHDAIIDRWSISKDRPAGLLYARTYGAVFETTDLFSAIKSRSPDALIVDDRCLCPPDFSGMLAPHADAALFSTGYAKHVDIGFGGYGMLREGVPYARTESSYSDSDLEEVTGQYKDALRTRTPFLYRESDWLDTAIPEETWVSYRERVEQEFTAASGLKQDINSIYASRLPPEIQLPSEFQSWRFNIQVKDKGAVIEVIRRAGLFASGHYDSLAGLFGPGLAPFAETLHRHVINLFNDRYFSHEQAEHLTDVLADSELLRPGPLFS